MKHLRKITTAAILLFSAAGAFAGPGPQYWARPIETNSKIETKAFEKKSTVNRRSKADKKSKAVKTAKQDAVVNSPKEK